jgi:dTMP kinase
MVSEMDMLGNEHCVKINVNSLSISATAAKGEPISMSARHFFLVIEGLDGAGKTETARHVVEQLKHALPDGDAKVLLTYEPHDPSFAGELIRQVLRKERRVSPRTLALAYAANRADHLDADIVPYLQGSEERIVVCDRYYLSSLVYQTTPDLSLDYVMGLNAGARRPDLTIFLNASTETCYQRLSKRGLTRELFDERLAEMRQKYATAIEFLRARGEPIIEVNADGSRAEVLAQIGLVATAHFPAWIGKLAPVDSSP